MRESRFAGRALQALLLALAMFLGGCSSGDDNASGYVPGSGQFGEPCQESEDCASGLCVRVDASHGICTHGCTGDVSCPTSPNWGCLQGANYNAPVCACAPTAASEVCGDGADNDCNGLIDDCQFCNGKPVPANDPQNCGSCGNACQTGQICSQGTCKCPPDAPFQCNGVCVDLDTNPGHCGSCGTVCPSGQSCDNGVCSCGEGDAQDYCPGVGCVDLQSSDESCGTCGNKCPYATVCFKGECKCYDTSKPDYCSTGCVNLQSDKGNCGACGNSCPVGQLCVDGSCECSLTGYLACNGTCINPKADANNCGSCGNACATGQGCVAGNCTCPTLTPNLCNGACTNTSTDKSNCGACGTVCGVGLYCLNGKCSCPYTTQTSCNGSCVYLSTDENNCGSCGNVCPAGKYCLSGTCSCSSGYTDCGNGCVNTSTDANNCGSCGNVCPGSQTCSGGTCKCPTGQGFCVATNQCKTLSSDPDNCGSCGNVCNSGESCVSGVCKCPTTGQKWCASTGTCTDTLANASHCGACDNACNPGEICQNSTCKCANYGEKWCASTGTCTDTIMNSSHCGACDNACPAGTSCSNYSCKCTTAGQTLCGSQCFDLQMDPAHCGSCNIACSSKQICSAGKCTCDAPIVGAATRLTNTVTDTVMPATAWSGSHVGVVYQENPAGFSTQPADLYFALLNADGTRAKTPDVALTTGGGVLSSPSIVWTGSEFGVVWTVSGSVMFRRIGADGTPVAAAENITTNTAGTKLPYNGTPSIAWSSTYGGYALSNQGSNTVYFQRIGATGATPDPVNAITASCSSSGKPAMAVSPSGEWGILVGGYGYGVYLILVNPDGSKTKPNVTMDSSSSGQVTALLYDGTTWVSAWHFSYNGLRLNRGETASPNLVVTLSSSLHPQMAITQSNPNVINLIWTQPNDIRMRRFLTSSVSSGFLPMGNEFSILSTQNALEVSAVQAGPTDLLVTWSDTRWGAPELYTSALSLADCP
ncbi:MAG: hypothetical protein H6717_35885 [Polyangiaceae bacterium]|nr:hypothetical protein [Polyangiaceae bacterium]